MAYFAASAILWNKKRINGNFFIQLISYQIFGEALLEAKLIWLIGRESTLGQKKLTQMVIQS